MLRCRLSLYNLFMSDWLSRFVLKLIKCLTSGSGEPLHLVLVLNNCEVVYFNIFLKFIMNQIIPMQEAIK